MVSCTLNKTTKTTFCDSTVLSCSLLCQSRGCDIFRNVQRTHLQQHCFNTNPQKANSFLASILALVTE